MVRDLEVYRGLDGILKFGVKCRLAGGHPTYMTRFIEEFENIVLAKCYGASDVVPSAIITDVPKDLIDWLSEHRDDWKAIATKYRDKVERLARELARERRVPV